MHDQEKDCVWGNGGDHRVATFVLDDGRNERSTTGGLANPLSGGGDGGSQRGEVFAVEVAVGPRVNQETITPQNHHGLDTIALSEGPHEVVYGGQ
jgi:hypothetical protein